MKNKTEVIYTVAEYRYKDHANLEHREWAVLEMNSCCWTFTDSGLYEDAETLCLKLNREAQNAAA